MLTIRIQEDDFDLADTYAEIRLRQRGKVGAVVSFIGLVRDRNVHAGDGAEVATLTLEHYPGMTESSIHEIAKKAEARWEVDDLVIIHRVGELQPEDQIVMVVAASAHRDHAFATAEFVMDYLKTDAIFWKKETSSGGTSWLASTEADIARARGWRETKT